MEVDTASVEDIQRELVAKQSARAKERVHP